MIKFNPSDGVRCDNCRGPKENQFRDLVGIFIFGDPLVLCNSCSLDMVRLLLDRFYPAWGNGPLYEILGLDE
jgi:hypothetical protein